MESVTVGIREGRVVLFNLQARAALAFSWRAAVEVARQMMWKARGVLAPDPETVAAVRVKRSESEIVVERADTGLLAFVAPLDAAHRVGEAMIGQARLLEEIERREEVVFDQALLLRTGRPWGLAVDPRLRDEAQREAHWNSDLRRYLPGGVPSTVKIGRPELIRHKRRVDDGQVRRDEREEAGGGADPDQQGAEEAQG